MPTVHGGGAERAMLNFSRELVRLGMQVDLVVGNFEGPLRELVPAGVRVVSFGASRLSYGIVSLIRYLNRERPAALYSTITNANVIAAVAGRVAKSPTRIIVRHSNVPISEPKTTWRRRLTTRLLPATYKLADGIIAVSEGVAQELCTLAPAVSSRVRVIPTPVLSPEVLEQGMEPAVHPWLAADAAEPVVLAAGRLQKQKGFGTLLKAFALVRQRQKARLIIIGEGDERQNLESCVESLGLQTDVSLPGFQSNPFSFMNQARVFVLASEFEGLPNVLIQAMAFGTPVVATDCKSGPREILEDGRLGALVPVGDVAELARAIERTLALPKQMHAALHVQARYGAEVATRQYLALAGL
jgi:glycosyltransferase involved in cell wall biosynthesis